MPRHRSLHDGALNRCSRLAMIVIACALTRPAHPDIADRDGARLDQPLQAIWRVQQLPFYYYSARSAYSCRGLTKKIRSILKAVGAHGSVTIETRCSNTLRVHSAHLSISLAAPVEATEANILDATTFKPHEALAARITGVSLPTAADLEHFAASWQRVSLPRHVEMGDCDLLNALSGQVLSKLRIRGAVGFACSNSPTRLRPTPGVEALLPTSAENR